MPNYHDFLTKRTPKNLTSDNADIATEALMVLSSPIITKLTKEQHRTLVSELSAITGGVDLVGLPSALTMSGYTGPGALRVDFSERIAGNIVGHYPPKSPSEKTEKASQQIMSLVSKLVPN